MTAPTLVLVAPSWSPTAWLVAVLVVAVLAVVTVLCVVRARRLDRLHRRTDAARAGLADALDRRGRVALSVADALTAGGAPGPRGAPRGPCRPDDAPDRPRACTGRAEDAAAVLRAAAHVALAACRDELGTPGRGLEPCEAAENTLTRLLAAVDRRPLPAALLGELAEAEQLVVLARRVHNDAVRDTVDLRSRRLVRWLRLAGTAPVPAYFEIADPPVGPARRRPSAPPARTGTRLPG